MATQFKYKPIVLMVASVLSASQMAYAAEAENDKKKKQNETDPEVIEVTGYRGSVLKSMLEKRATANVSDSIFAEDIGKSTDQNIADALSRVTGISIQSEGGEGTKISVRGTNPNQNVITLNGVQLTSAGDNQGVDLSAFSSDILSKITVVKTASADHDEGSLGATVNLETGKPLNRKNNARSLTIQGRYNGLSEESDYKLSGSFSDKFLDETFGFAATVFKETQSFRSDRFIVAENQYQAVQIPLASDQNGDMLTDTHAILRGAAQYSMLQNKRDRQGGNFVFQWLPTDTTNVLVDFNYSKQTLVNDDLAIQTRTRADSSLLEKGVKHDSLPNNDDIANFSDPALDWIHINTDTHTVDKYVNRFGDGGYNRAEGIKDIVNKSGGIRIEQYVTDDLRMDFNVSYSETVENPGPSSFITMQGFQIPQTRLALAGEYGTNGGIQPVGYDCRDKANGVCELEFGNGLIVHNDPDTNFDNDVITGFNPDDRAATNIGYMGRTVRSIEDTFKSASLDFDWDVEFGPLVKLEFGAKANQRTKFVDNQVGKFDNTTQATTVPVFDNDGNYVTDKVIKAGDTVTEILGSEIASTEEFPHNNFMEELGVSRNAATDGWPMIDSTLAFERALGSADAALTVNNSQTREMNIDTQAAYLKLNFSAIDDRLTADVGLRYVKDEVNTWGYSGTTYQTDPVLLHRIFDPFYALQLRNSANPSCHGQSTANTGPYELADGFTTADGQTSVEYDTTTPGREYAYARVDGLGWYHNGTLDDSSDDIRLKKLIDTNEACYDPYTDMYQGFAVNAQGQPNVGWVTFARHSDVTTSTNYHMFTDQHLNAGTDELVRDRKDIQNFRTTGNNEYSMLLPSLNLNFALSDDLITRFAVSKTMSRPRIDSLKPGFSVTESVWGTRAGNRVTLSNPKLVPLESKNLDLSVEWYFNKTGMVGAAFFYKDMTNFEETVDYKAYLDDLRIANLDGYNADNLLKTQAEVIEDFSSDEDKMGVCFPKRAIADQVRQDYFISGDFDNEGGVTTQELLDKCALFNVEEIRNGKGAEIAGVELQYQQSYDFLPGLWSGLGINANYTYQESQQEADAQAIALGLAALPSERTPTHSYNATVYWEKFGHQLRLSYRGKSDELVQTSWGEGALWQEGDTGLDFNASYKINNQMTVSFQALNITDTATRHYYTSRNMWMGDYMLNDDGSQILEGGLPVEAPFDEGNALVDDVYKGRTQMMYKTGTNYRLNLRVNF
ncbi:TonB-dependent receptor [Catenovulum maritimum]|uniref:TonB-dependent receptor n=1 Tax=Catenovulum maritimum TaxID=1513271 RepID=A0A0J8GVQ6_9ALTE|nr:TonB-dependent receptor [Catenovulum maritimum]KMT66865.1 hypothetical protein XM47_01780 [Catenovulum maritimum]